MLNLVCSSCETISDKVDKYLSEIPIASYTMVFLRFALCKVLLLLLLLQLLSCTFAFQPAFRSTGLLNPTSTRQAAGKGFGPSPPPLPTPKQRPDPPDDRSSATVPTTIASLSSSLSSSSSLNQGQAALAELRRERAEKRDAELRMLRDVRTVDTQLRENPGSAAIPEQVAMRMGKRMLPFVGIPLLGGMGAFVVFWYLASYKNQEFQPALVAFSTIGLLGVGLLGITYSVMSASWDPEREGSFLGTDEFSKNLDSLRGGLKRSRDNTITREKMAGMSNAEIDAAIQGLNQREEKVRQDKME